ncbi:DUF1403 family protein [Rhizobium sp. SGZ-381]|uniref:DUF1403 family protein n=1 Tax=Rhizobium sp. SGZ-381 TaxID=3342800 RepID=UPI0036706201
MIPARPSRQPDQPVFQVPAWATRRAAVESDAEAAFLAGGALLALDRVMRADYPWAGAWRQRQALKCGVAAVRLSGRREEEAQLRDAWVLRRPGDDAGPSGNMYGAWKRLAARPLFLEAETLKGLVGLLDLRWLDELEAVPHWCEAAARETASPPHAMAQIVSRIMALGAAYELLAWWVADQLLKEMMGWPVALPLMMAQRQSAYFRAERSQKRLSPDADGFTRALTLSLADAAIDAVRFAGDIDRRAQRLMDVVPKLRAKGAGDAIDLLLSEDAVSGSLATAKLSRFASRRLFERLLEFGAIRELSGRPNSRVFGL